MQKATLGFSQRWLPYSAIVYPNVCGRTNHVPCIVDNGGWGGRTNVRPYTYTV